MPAAKLLKGSETRLQLSAWRQAYGQRGGENPEAPPSRPAACPQAASSKGSSWTAEGAGHSLSHFFVCLSGGPTCWLAQPWLLEPCLLRVWVLGSRFCAEGSLGRGGLSEVELLGATAALRAWASKNCRSFARRLQGPFEVWAQA